MTEPFLRIHNQHFPEMGDPPILESVQESHAETACRSEKGRGEVATEGKEAPIA